MALPEEPKGAPAPEGSAPSLPSDGAPAHEVPVVTYEPVNENSDYAYHGDSYNYGADTGPVSPVSTQPGSYSQGTYAPVIPVTSSPSSGASGGGKTPPPPDPPSDDDEDDGMLRMSFLGHLEELRKRLLLMLAGCGVAFIVSLLFSNELWIAVSAPAVDALTQLGVKPPNLVQISPMDGFNIIWMKLPILCSIFIASPWILYQVWAFIAPGLYKKERRWAAPFVICSAGLFILGGAFAYFVAFRYGLKFLLGISMDSHVTPMPSMVDYFDLFVDVMLGIGLVFEIPILIFFLTLLRIVTPKFLIKHSRYAILAIVIIAAVVTPTPDVFNLMLFATPMCLLFYIGIFASYLLVLSREGRRFPWKYVVYVVMGLLLIASLLAFVAVTRFGYHYGTHWPFFHR